MSFRLPWRWRSTLEIIEVLLPKHSLIHVPQPGEEETQSKFAMTDSGDGARGVEVEEKFEGRSVHISALGELNCVVSCISVGL